MDDALDRAVRAVKVTQRSRKNKRSRLFPASSSQPVQATALSTELQFMVAWGVLHASAAAVLARKQKEDYDLLGVPVPTEIRQMAAVGKSGEITSHCRRDFFKKFKPLAWLPTPVPSRVITKGKRGSVTRYPFFTVIPVLMVNELFDCMYHHAKDIFDQLRGNLEDFWNQVRFVAACIVFWLGKFASSLVFLYSPSACVSNSKVIRQSIEYCI